MYTTLGRIMSNVSQDATDRTHTHTHTPGCSQQSNTFTEGAEPGACTERGARGSTTRARRNRHLHFYTNAQHAPVLCESSPPLSAVFGSAFSHVNSRDTSVFDQTLKFATRMRPSRGRASLRPKFLSVSVPDDLAARRWLRRVTHPPGLAASGYHESSPS